MIGSLTGQVVKVFANSVLLDVAGVGYIVYLPQSRFADLSGTITIFTKQITREDGSTLFGFPDWEMRKVFEEMMSVQGIGPKTALLLLERYDFPAIREAFETANLPFFTTIPGIGEKTAEKLVFELRRKFKSGNPLVEGNSKQQEVIAALEILGYNKSEATSAIASIRDWEQSIEALVKEALKHYS